jgi:hypothetical protein
MVPLPPIRGPVGNEVVKTPGMGMQESQGSMNEPFQWSAEQLADQLAELNDMRVLQVRALWQCNAMQPVRAYVHH